MPLDEIIENEDQLERILSRPSEQTREILSHLDGEIMVLGAAGKMGPTLCRLIKNAAPDKTIYAVSRFSEPAVKDRLEQAGVATLVADLAEPANYKHLPVVPNVYYMVGMKFGASSNEPLTWAMNAYVPGLVCEHFRSSRIVGLSTGNVNPFVGVHSGGAVEDVTPDPVGEYAQSCLARERIFEYFSKKHDTPVVLIRLNYANEVRYGVIVDIVQKILAGEPVDLTVGYVNLIWQGDANDYIARSITLARTPAEILNVTGPGTISVRELAGQIGEILDRDVHFAGRESETALLSSAQKCFDTFGLPSVTLSEMTRTITHWVAAGKRLLGKPTKFNVRNGKF